MQYCSACFQILQKAIPQNTICKLNFAQNILFFTWFRYMSSTSHILTFLEYSTADKNVLMYSTVDSHFKSFPTFLLVQKNAS